MASKEVLEEIEEKITKATKLITEAQKLANENGVVFRTGIIRKTKEDEETGEEVDLDEDDDYDVGYIRRLAGWSPSGLNC